MLRIFSLFLMLVAPTTSQATAQEPNGTNDLRGSVEQVAQKYLTDNSLEMVSIGVTYRGEQASLHLGPLYRDEADNANDTTIFEIRSITKTFTGTLAARAILDGKLSLNEDIRTYLTGDYPNLELEGKPILIRHLLTHTSGLPSNNPSVEAVLESGPDGNQNDPFWRRIRDAELAVTRQEFIANLSTFTLATVPGQTFNYSNLGTNLVAHLLERVYGRTYSELLTDHILKPAGMNETRLAIRDEVVLARLVSGYNQDGEHIPAWPVWTIWGAEGALKSTVPDMIRYMEFQLSEKNPATKLAHVPLHQLAEDAHIAAYWLAVDTPNGTVSYRHNGGYENVRNTLIIYPGDDLGIYVVTNRITSETSRNVSQLTSDIRDALLD